MSDNSFGHRFERRYLRPFFHWIKSFFHSPNARPRHLDSLSIARSATQRPVEVASGAWAPLMKAVCQSMPPRLAQRQLLVDVSALVVEDLKTGIQRVVRSLLKELLVHSNGKFRLEPVYATPDQGYRYARRFMFGLLDCPPMDLTDDPIEYQAGDLFLGLDFHPLVVPKQRAFYQQLRQQGVQVRFVVYDLLPITLPHAFPSKMTILYPEWLNVISESDGAICISKAVAGELADWLKVHGPSRQRPFAIDWFHLGANIDASIPSKGLPETATTVLAGLADRPSFLMVGTIEPRKGHTQALNAFERLWADGVEANLVIVGKQGWKMEALADRLRGHRENGNRLLWLEGISDEYVERIYEACACLIAASEGEGFGLPLIEAAQHQLPIIARDIPVFREVAGERAHYFSGSEPQDMANSIHDWLELKAANLAPRSDDMPRLSWRQSAEQLLTAILPDDF